MDVGGRQGGNDIVVGAVDGTDQRPNQLAVGQGCAGQILLPDQRCWSTQGRPGSTAERDTVGRHAD